MSVFLSVKYLLPLVMPFFLAVCIVYYIYPPLQRLEKVCGVKKSVLAGGILLLAGAVTAVLIWYGTLAVCGLLTSLAGNLDLYENSFCSFVHSCCFGIEKRTGINADAMEELVFFHADRFTEDMKQRALPSLMNHSVSYVKWICHKAAFLAITLIATVLLAKDFCKIRKKLHKYSWFIAAEEIGSRIGHLAGSYLRAQGIILCTITAVCTAGLWAAGIGRPVLMGAAAGLLDMLPFIGTGFVLVPAALWQLVQGKVWQCGGILLLYGGCILIRELLEPKLLGKRMGIYPIMILLAIYTGVKLYGVAGVILGPFSFLLMKEIYRKAVDFCEND